MQSDSRPKWSKSVSIFWSIAILIVGILLVVGFFYLDKNNRISLAIQFSPVRITSIDDEPVE